MMTTAPVSFHRALSDYVTVAIDGVVLGVDPDIVCTPPARVVITMQDDTAHCLAHLFEQIAQLGDILDWQPDGILVPELATALHEAAEYANRPCHSGMELPPTGEPMDETGPTSDG